MAKRKAFLLRLPDDLLDELNRWARDELRSVNAQIEYVLRREVIEHRRRQLRSAIDEGTAEEDQPPADPA